MSSRQAPTIVARLQAAARPGRRPHLIAAAAATAAVLAWVTVRPAASAAPQSRGSSPCAITTTERVVAVGDVHGAYDRLVTILRQAGLIDSRDRWSGGRAIFVQTGDVVDRGPASRRALDLLRRLERESADAGGAVHALLGNHEVMRMMRDLRDVSPEEYVAFRSREAESLRDRYYDMLLETEPERAQRAGRRFEERTFRKQFLDAIPLGFVEMQIAFEPGGEYGAWLRRRHTMVRINDVAFVHGGVSPAVAALGCEKINATVHAELEAAMALDDPSLPRTLSAGPDGPLWYRGLADDTSPLTTSQVGAVLESLGARTIVIGHTVAPGHRITARHDRQVVQIDTGMLGRPFYPGGRSSALEIHRGAFTAIYEGDRQLLFERPPAGAGRLREEHGVFALFGNQTPGEIEDGIAPLQ